MTVTENEVILFDGVCNFCNSSVNFIIDKDKRDVFRFASLQSDFGQECLKDFNLPADSFSTLILVSNGKYFTRSSAALRIAKDLSFPYSLSFAFIVIPPFIRNLFYDIIARNRYRWFGKKEVCRIPSAEERAKFIE
ncbi:MAG: DCC1-like thiol-disulfide oxidoreductase family protein [Ignavibacteriota bacterium]|nr:DCC1-like thiol-disulfide oxidoreductase family protein [Ignavibacteriota bacterium]